MPLLFSILEHYNLLSKQPNYTCDLFFADLMFMAVSWARAIMSISKKGLDFSREALLLYIIFPKINRKPNNSKTEGRKGHTRPPGQPRGEGLPCRFLAHPGSSWRDILGPRGSPVWERAALQVPLSSHDFVTVWAHPGSSGHLKKGMATHSSILAWRIPWAEEPGGFTVQGVTKSRTWLSDFHFLFAVWIYRNVKSFLWLFVNASYRFS